MAKKKQEIPETQSDASTDALHQSQYNQSELPAQETNDSKMEVRLAPLPESAGVDSTVESSKNKTVSIEVPIPQEAKDKATHNVLDGQTSCLACESDSTRFAFKKDGCHWIECLHCESLYALEIAPQETGGHGESARNLEPLNQTRLQRVLSCGKIERILDYGCGSGHLVEYIRGCGLEAEGYDPTNPQYSEMPSGQFDAAVLMETIEHLREPMKTLQDIHGKLYNGGILMIESSFRYGGQSIPQLEKWDYVDHTIGHNLILSVGALMDLLKRAGFKLLKGVNVNVFLFQKT